MALSRLVKLFLASVYCTQFVLCSENVPVFMWGNLERPSEKATPLSHIYEPEFVDILRDRLKSEPFTVVFIEENLSVEDLSHKNSVGESSFPYLRSTIASSYYLPAVDSPTAALDKFANSEEVDHVKLTENGLSAEIKPDGGKYLFISLKDAREGESRAQLLRRHNNFIEDMFAKLEKRYDKVVGIYTGHYPSWTVAEHSRVRRQAMLDETVLRFTNVLLYTKNISLVEGDTVTLLNGMTEHSTDYNETSHQIEVSVTYPDHKLKMYFVLASGYWYFNKVDVEKTVDSTTQTVVNNELYAIKGFSYRCAQTVQFIVNSTTPYKLVFTDMQVQPFFDTPYIGFGEPYYCVGFTSVPIWACLFVVFILLSIMFFGIMMMMDIRTMDRFDDPKGKTITISSLE